LKPQASGTTTRVETIFLHFILNPRNRQTQYTNSAGLGPFHQPKYLPVEKIFHVKKYSANATNVGAKNQPIFEIVADKISMSTHIDYVL